MEEVHGDKKLLFFLPVKKLPEHGSFCVQHRIFLPACPSPPCTSHAARPSGLHTPAPPLPGEPTSGQLSLLEKVLPIFVY